MNTLALSTLVVSVFATTACGAPDPQGEGNPSQVADDAVQTVSEALTLPTPTATCPTFVNGTMTFKGQTVRVWKGAQHTGGAVVIYWHGTGSAASEAITGLGQAAINDITANGGIVAAPDRTTGTGSNTGNSTWFTGDFAIADEIVACARQKLSVNQRKIYTVGFSSGGLQATSMGYARSAYVAAVGAYSGGLIFPATLQDPNEVPVVMGVHGAPGQDVIIIDFSATTHTWEQDIKAKGSFAIDCNHGGGHTIPPAVVPSMYAFLKAHPYDVTPEPYRNRLPASFPSYCAIQ